MAPSLFNFRELRRRSRASFRTDVSTDTSSDASGSHGTAPTAGSLTPPSVSSSSDPSLNLPGSKDSLVPPSPAIPRPPLSAAAPGSSRNSVSGMSGLGYPPMNYKPSAPLSQYAPRILNIAENAWVYQKVILLTGTIGEPAKQAIDGTVSVSRLDDTFPQINWPVCSSHFKCLVYLQPGANRIRLEFTNPKLRTSAPVHVSHLTLHMLPPTSSPPLQLAILIAKDSPETFDAMPARIEREGNELELAVRKFRMAAYLWQAFTAEQMFRNRLGRRAFRFEEEWMLGSSTYRDSELCTMRSEARVHIIRTDKTVEEIRDLDKAQQYGKATDKNALFDIAAEAVKGYFKPMQGQKQYVSVLILDAHWDPAVKTIRGHAALGGSAGDLHLAVFGSHCLQSYPASFEEIVPAFTDCTPTDTNHVANDCNQAGSSWEAANIGIGAHLHEVGHLFGCPHQESGVMLRDYVTLNRTFVAREAYCTRTRSKGGPVSVEDECKWHRLDCLRFRSHPCFRLPNDPVLHPDNGLQVYPIDGDTVSVMATTGISFLEIFVEGDDVCRTWIEYPVENGAPQRQIDLVEDELRAHLPNSVKRGAKLKLSVKSYGGGNIDIPDFKTLCSKESTVKLGKTGRLGFRGQMVGLSRLQNTQAHEVVFVPSGSKGKTRVVSKIVVFHGRAVDGLEFVFDDGSVEMFGKKGGKPGGDTFDLVLDIRRGEYLAGFHVRAGAWIDGIQILTSVGRKSQIYGNSKGGSPQTLIPPSGYNVVGVAGTCGAWVDGFSLIVSR
ncbi:hypothetical protein jhhlp_005697 [Lomentospora prolificans]|uniref:Jacalin-type lectin domain-containing protein n=1 Tax=Lomentospora prolificans TaxID=41688 RepID=A0A2N3N3V4_9PEZI|nr:hypothetical protein jhhlp_005697 [Lomentospora prolificans]